ncbi:MAG: ABC transporter permease subunit [Clostridia bacterium]|nr:ABC transporter permease subunit [Clostridia bacterium]
MRDKLLRLLRGVAVAIFWLTVWAGGCYLANRTLLIPLPYPWDVAKVLWQLVGEISFWTAVGMSLLRVVAGFAVALAAGVALAMLTTRFAVVHTLLSPILSVIKATPVASFILLAFLWIRAENMPTFIAFLMVIPLVWENVRQGILHTDKKLLEMAKVFRLSYRQRLWHIRFPAVKPYLQAAVTTGFGFAWKAGVAAEILCWTGDSIGYHIAAEQQSFETAHVFAWTAVMVVLSVVLERLMRRLMNRREVAA